MPEFDKILPVAKQHRKFDFEDSVFSDWKQDNPKIIEQALAHDAQYWKMFKMTKDVELCKSIMNLVRSNWETFNEIWLGLLADGGDYPSLSQYYFRKFCK